MDNNLREILTRYKETADLLESEIKSFENLDLTKKNIALEKEADRLNSELVKLREKVSQLNESNSQLRNTIYSKLYSERLSLINSSKKKTDAYFAYEQSKQNNRLTELENKYRRLIDAQINEIKSGYSVLDEELRAKIASRTHLIKQELSDELADEVSAAKMRLAETAKALEDADAEYGAIRAEKVNAQDIERIAKQSNWERFLGLNVINKVGIGLVILGVIFASQYTYSLIGNGLKAVLSFALGGVMVAIGELLSRKKASVFSLGITSGGIAVAYIALTVSYFMFGVLTLYSAALICVGITVGAFLLSIQHKSQVVATFALIGGFLPLMILDALDETLTYSAMAYFLILGGFAFVLSFKKKWIVTAFFGLSLNIITTFMLSGLFNAGNSVFEKSAFIVYVALSFITYTLIPIIGTYYGRLHFKKRDVTLIAINTFFSTVILYLNFARLEIVELNGLIPLVFMLIYIGLGLLLKWKMQTEYDMRMLFFVTAVTFFALIIPMHFESSAWFSLGWLVQGVGLAVYGIIAEKRKFIVSGFIINGLCLGGFLMIDLFAHDESFLLRYAALTLGGLILTAVFAFKRVDHNGIKILKYAASLNLWLFTLYIIAEGVNKAEELHLFYPLFCIPATFALAFVLQRIKPIKDTGMRVISHIMYSAGILWLLIMNFTDESHLAAEGGIWPVYAFAYAAANITALLALSDILYYQSRTSLNALRSEWFPFLLSLFFTFILTQNLIGFYDIPFAGMTISIVYAVLALLWCIFGFWKRFTFMRRFGLAMSLLVVSKLFLIDMWALSEGYRIITYFALGLSLIGISFVYQHFTKRLDKVDELEINE
ncbi:MAG: DUF2339 domain-containing protein [Oscillospiraceae bacterium]|nr:DUF2339 domain-containing protein [Oscillospiraceae bacterium]